MSQHGIGSQQVPKRISTSLIIFTACAIGLGIGLLGLNFWHATKCASDRSPDEIEDMVIALKNRLLQSESQLLKNEIMMNKLIASMQSNLFKLEQKEYEQLSLQSKNEAVEIALQLAQHPAPPMPVFNLDQKYYDAGTLADAIDDVFGRDGELKTSYEQSFESQQGSEGMDAEAPLTDAEATEICTDWKKQYNVVVGVSWGDLPYDLQQKWLHYSCDYHMQDEVV